MAVTPQVLPWQASLWAQLRALEEGGRLPHALLLSGIPGLGKRVLAARLMRWLLCNDHVGRDAPCGSCRGCTLALAGSHPDLSRLDAEEDKTTIGVGQVRALIEYVQLTPSHCDRKLILVEQADDLGVPAANTLLKVLEEPPGSALFVLVADRVAALPVTVRSRCQRIRLRRPDAAQAIRWLEEQGAGSDPASLLELAAGAPLRALELARGHDVPVLAGIREDVARLMSHAIDPVSAAKRWSSLGPAETVAAVSSAVSAEIRACMLADEGRGRQVAGQALDSRRLFDALDECTRVRALVERRTLSPNEQVMAAQRLALACSTVVTGG